ncbi:MAG: prepilin-type N-terminal cleavage/methylation domain-containing protein [Desulfobacterales bacterium]
MKIKILANYALNGNNFCFFNNHYNPYRVENKSKNSHKLCRCKTESGLTLIELLIAMAVGSIIIAAIYSVYISQVRSQATQRAALEMQQGLRAALTIMELEIRTAGVDPLGTAGARVLVADVDEFHFTRDIGGRVVDGMDQFDGDTDDPNENVRYAVNTNGDLGRDTGNSGILMPLLDNVDAINFVYLDRMGEPIVTPVATEALDAIRQVQITVVERYGQSQGGLLRAVVDNNVYENQQGDDVHSLLRGSRVGK